METLYATGMHLELLNLTLHSLNRLERIFLVHGKGDNSYVPYVVSLEPL